MLLATPNVPVQYEYWYSDSILLVLIQAVSTARKYCVLLNISSIDPSKILRIAQYKQCRPPANTAYCIVLGKQYPRAYCVLLNTSSINPRKYWVLLNISNIDPSKILRIAQYKEYRPTEILRPIIIEQHFSVNAENILQMFKSIKIRRSFPPFIRKYLMVTNITESQFQHLREKNTTAQYSVYGFEVIRAALHITQEYYVEIRTQ